jgi:hypothetical protein
MNKTAIGLSLVLLLCYSIASACTIKNPKNVEMGASKGIEGVCSNTDAAISCEYVSGAGVRCHGPSGSFSGSDLSQVVFSACGCSYETMPERDIQNKLNQNK